MPAYFFNNHPMSMYEELKQKLGMLTTVPSSVDPSQFGDPLATQTAWTPIRRGGSSFRTHKLVTVDPSRIEFRASLGAILFYLLFMLFGLAFFASFFVSRFPSHKPSADLPVLVPLLVTLIFAAVGGYLLYTGTAPIVFEKGRGVFWKGRKGPDEAIDSRNTDKFVRLDHVHALQLVSEYCRGNKSSYYSYELNLVLKDGKRVNVVDHGNRDKIREDARVLAAFLGKPLWDAITTS